MDKEVIIPTGGYGYGGFGNGMGWEALIIGALFGGGFGGWGRNGVAAGVATADAISNTQIALDLQKGICDVSTNVSNGDNMLLNALNNQSLATMQRFCDNEKETAAGFAMVDNKLDSQTYKTLSFINSQTGLINEKINGVTIEGLNTKFELSKQLSDCCCATEKQIMALDAKLTAQNYETQLREQGRENARLLAALADQKDAFRDFRYDCREGARYNNLSNYDYQILRTLGQVPNPPFPVCGC